MSYPSKRTIAFLSGCLAAGIFVAAPAFAMAAAQDSTAAATEFGKILLGIAGGTGCMHLFHYLRNVKRDAIQTAAVVKKDASTLAMDMWVQVSKEQQEWREQLRKEMSELRTENDGLRRKIAELEAANTDLHDDNTRLVNRVRTLERALANSTKPDAEDAAVPA